MTFDPSRALEDCPLVIFIAYTVGPEAEPNGYSEWLGRIDMPFFNAIPGTHHYANWRVTDHLRGAKPAWDYFDFQGLESEDDLERVWFNPDLDAFRANWISLWGYGAGAPPAVSRHAYLMRPLSRPHERPKDRTLLLAGGQGEPAADPAAHQIFRVEKILHKHFGSAKGNEPWLTSASDFNPLGLDWLSVAYGTDPVLPDAAELAMSAKLIAAPDRVVDSST